MDAFPVAFASSSAGTGLAALNARSFFSLYDCGYSNRQMQRVAVRAVLIALRKAPCLRQRVAVLP